MPCMRADENRRKDLFYFLSDERAFFSFSLCMGSALKVTSFSRVCVCATFLFRNLSGGLFGQKSMPRTCRKEEVVRKREREVEDSIGARLRV